MSDIHVVAADETRRALIEQHAERGYRTQPLDRDNPPAALASLLIGVVHQPAPEEQEYRAA